MRISIWEIIRLSLLLLLIFVVIAFFFPKRLYIHYENPALPIEVKLENYDQTAVRTVVADQSEMMLIRRPLVETIFSKDRVAKIHWAYVSDQSWIGRLNLVGQSGQPYLPEVCRLDIYLDKKARFIRYETTGFLFLNFCF